MEVPYTYLTETVQALECQEPRWEKAKSNASTLARTELQTSLLTTTRLQLSATTSARAGSLARAQASRRELTVDSSHIIPIVSPARARDHSRWPAWQ
jgi:hypothetical protein